MATVNSLKTSDERQGRLQTNSKAKLKKNDNDADSGTNFLFVILNRC